MEKLNVVSKKLKISKGKIKDMIKENKIPFELKCGVYYVNENDVKQKLVTNQNIHFKFGGITKKSKISKSEILDDNSLLVWLGDDVNSKTKLQPQNRGDYKSQKKSPHTVKTHYRKQPYGSRENPKYRMIKIESFVKGGKKVG